MKSEPSIKKTIKDIRNLQKKKTTIENAITRAEAILREELYDCHDILTLSKKMGINKYMDDILEISGGEQISVKMHGKPVLTGIITPKYGGLHLVITKATPVILEATFSARLKTVKKNLRKELNYANKLSKVSFEEKLVVNRDRIKKRLITDVSTLENQAKKLGITNKFINKK